jgi:hypothetical protein
MGQRINEDQAARGQRMRGSGRRGPARWLAVHWLAVAVLLLGFGLRVHRLGEDALWYDEVIQLRVATAPTVRSFLGQLRRHPMALPLDWFSTRVMAGLGDQELWLRLPALWWGTLALAATYRLGRQVTTRPAAVLGTFLTALWAFHVRYSQELRTYAPLGFFYLLSASLLIRAARQPWHGGRWAAAAAGLGIGSYVHAYVLFALGNGYAAWAAAPLARRYRAWGLGGLAGVTAAVGLMFAPAYYFFGRQHYFDYNLYEFGRTFWRTLGQGLGWLSLNYADDSVIFAAWEGIVAAGLAAGLAWMAARPHRHRWLWALAAGAAASVALIYIGDVWRRYWFLARQLVHLGPVVLLIAATGLAGLGRAAQVAFLRRQQAGAVPSHWRAEWARYAAVALFAGATFAFSLPNLARYYAFPRTTARDIAAVLAERRQPGEPIYVVYPYERAVYDYYLNKLPGGQGMAAELRPLELDELPSLRDVPGTVYLALTPRATAEHYAQIEALGFRPLYRWPGNWLGAQSLFVREIGYN